MSAVMERQQTLPGAPEQAAVTPMQLLQFAMSQGADLDRLERLMQLQRQWEAGEARKAYVAAMAAFKSEPIQILKSKEVNIPGGAKFSHATLADVVDGVAAALSRHGLSHAWETKQEDKQITVTCIVTHEAGHSERTTLFAPPDDSGKKNTIQQIASTVTYLQRYTLMAACGLAAKDMDDDGRGSAPAPRVPAPDGYESWKADMNAKAQEGNPGHLEAWKASKPEFRNFAATHDLDWWEGSKNTARKNTK
jgi:hypothetical protein